MIAAATLALAPSIFGAIRGGAQKRKAEELRARAVDPGYQMNQGVIDNARMLGERASNYQIAGYDQALSNINQAYTGAFNQGVQGASSGGDVLDLATRIAYGQGQATNQLDMQNAQGREGAFNDYLGANAAAGQEFVNRNQYDRSRYQQQLAEAAAMYQAGETNIGNAIGDVANVGTAMVMNPAQGGVNVNNNPRKFIPPHLRGGTVGFTPQSYVPRTKLPYN